MENSEDFMETWVNSEDLMETWVGSALALTTAPSVSTCACVLTRTGAHSDGQHSHALCLWPLRHAWAHLHRAVMGLPPRPCPAYSTWVLLYSLCIHPEHREGSSSPSSHMQHERESSLRAISDCLGLPHCCVCPLTIHSSFRFPRRFFPSFPTGSN